MVDEGFTTIRLLLFRHVRQRSRRRERVLDARAGESDKAAMKTTAIIGICIIG
jgi:hypothetical protein